MLAERIHGISYTIFVLCVLAGLIDLFIGNAVVLAIAVILGIIAMCIAMLSGMFITRG